ncbi:unnamed protein product [Meloidogyne enterolobii]|uniref:Aminopeptidase N-like N-terminal domain-containing protein n=3 Tax=Meloidogyne enterolobii TaxID=390850 RepID=A0A6V7XK96_MELEN|nr:unnamed protein product [Meloidogyne enterolobii]
MADKFSRIPELAKTSRYEIRLAPCLETFKLKGSEKIHLDILKPTNYLKLYSKGIEIENASLKLADGTVIKEIKNELDCKWELLTVNFPSELPPQRIELNFDFNGEISSELSGFYR